VVLRGGVVFAFSYSKELHRVQLAKRPYGPDATQEERNAIADRVSVIGERLLLMHELTVQTPFSVSLIFDRLEALTKNWDRFAYVLDLTDATRPDAEVRAAIKSRISRISERVVLVAAVVGDNRLMRAMVRLVGYGLGIRNISVCRSRQEAISEARRALDC
jgi:hypothetical protein